MTSLITSSSPLKWQSDALEVHLLGLVDYEAARFLQERMVYEISGRNDLQGGLLICEHPPLISVGREGCETDILASKETLDACEIKVRRVNRGGGTIVHAPGQLAIYPIIPLNRIGMGLAKYRSCLRNILVAMCNELHIPAFFELEDAGMFCRCGQFAQLGVAVKAWTTYHGLFINVDCDLQLQQLVQPGSHNKRITSLSAQLAKPVAINAVRESIMRHLSDQLNYQTYHTYTSHPLLKRTRRKIVSALT